MLVVAILLPASTAAAADAGVGEQGSVCADNTQCLSPFQCVDGYCCNASCNRGCEACNAEDRWQQGQNGTCSAAPPHGEGRQPICGAYLCSGTSPDCATSCERDDACAAGSYCAAPECKAKLNGGDPCTSTTGHECLSGSCVPLDGLDTDAGAPRVCCNDACSDGPCKACVKQLTGVDNGVCANVLNKEKLGPQRCEEDKTNPCGLTGYCDGMGNCAFHTEGVVSSTCSTDAGAIASVSQVCDGKGMCACRVDFCDGACREGTPCLGDAATNDAPSSSIDAPPDAAPNDASRSDERSEPDAGADSRARFCQTRYDCVAPDICHRNNKCGPGRVGERCWPPSGEAGVFDPDGLCVPGTPDDPPEVIGSCSTSPGAGGAAGWRWVLVALGMWSARRARRFRQ